RDRNLEGPSNPRAGSKKIIPSLPFNRLNILSCNQQALPRRKKDLKKMGEGNKSGCGSVESDPITDSVIPQPELCDVVNVAKDFDIEVVLP
ncbi:hypothetical protein A2U01_0078180, partial [Trifolium medium]|nr:hypothetical protein [Trifolium medium]